MSIPPLYAHSSATFIGPGVVLKGEMICCCLVEVHYIWLRLFFTTDATQHLSQKYYFFRYCGKLWPINFLFMCLPILSYI